MAIAWTNYNLFTLLAELDPPRPPDHATCNLAAPVLAYALAQLGWEGRLLIRELKVGRSQFYLAWNGEVRNLSRHLLPKGPGRIRWETVCPSEDGAAEALKHLDAGYASKLQSCVDAFALRHATPSAPIRPRRRARL